MKKFLCFLIVVVMLMSGCMSVMASDGKVEISFCVGDDTLIINGTPVTVEKPYVVGEGVTLVPVRVITEAFDAKVDWIDETQTVKLTYPDVNIVIQIGNTVAEINGRAETLLAAPELTESGYTMVPLRFISENFGADVSYDEATERITVTKEKSDDSDASIQGTVNSKYIGDSFFKWSMENPVGMTMEYRSFDGLETVFSDENNVITIDIYTYDAKDYDFESDYNEIKLAISDLTLVTTEKNTDNPRCKSFHFGAKDKSNYYDYQQYVTPDFIYIIDSELKNDDTKVRDNYLNVLSTFACNYEQSDIYDLSNIKDGFRKFEAEHLKFSFNVPENFFMASSDESQNKFEFYELGEGVSSIRAVVYSKGDKTTVKSLATDDYNHNKALLNENITTFEGVKEKQYEKISATEYSYIVKATKKSYRVRDVFFEDGDYIYNISVTVSLARTNYDEYIDGIINSVDTEPLNIDEVGIFIKNTPEATGTIQATVGKAKITMPNIYVKVASNDDALAYVGTVNGIAVYAAKTAATNVELGDIRDLMQQTADRMKEEGSTMMNPVHQKVIDEQKCFAFKEKTPGDEGMTYTEHLACYYKGNVYLFSVGCSELMHSESTKAEIKKIIEGITFEK